MILNKKVLKTIQKTCIEKLINAVIHLPITNIINYMYAI